MNCPVCSGKKSFLVKTLYDDRYGYPARFTLKRCKKCCHIFLQTDRFSSENLADLYTNFYPRASFDLKSFNSHEEMSGFFAWLDGVYSSAFRNVPPGVRVLDIGCGFGQSLGYHKSRGCDVYGVEADGNIRRVAEKFNFNVHVGLFKHEIYEDNFFDYVTMDQVLEHVVDPCETLRGVAKILKPGGRAIITTPNAFGWGARIFGSRWINWHTPYHMQFYSKTSMALVAEKAGLEIESIKTITASAWLHYQWLHLLTYPDYCQPSAFWAGMACGNTSTMNRMEKLSALLLGMFNKLKINHLFTRIFDLLGMGDSQTFVLIKP